MDEHSLKVLNPWWESPAAIDHDLHLQAVANKRYYFDNPIKRELALDRGKTYILRGPRQVGKTTLIKEMIAQGLTQKRVDPHHCLFLTCESIKSYPELESLLVKWLSKRQGHPVLVCLDEITFILEWQRVVLLLINSGLFSQATTFISGSNARDLKEMGERFPGRGVFEKRIYPLSPKDYQTLPIFKSLPDEALLDIYSRIGGFPHAIRDYDEHGDVTDETCETYANWIFGDAYRFNLSRDVLLHILFRIHDTLASQMTYQRLVEKSPVRSHETAAAYVEHLEAAFLCHVLPCYDPDKDMAAPRKAKKFYFIDPLLYQVAAGYLSGIRNIAKWWKDVLAQPTMRGNIFESIVVSSFMRRFERSYFWYASSTQQEVDMVIRKGNETKLYEVKLQQRAIPPALGHPVELITPQNFFSYLSG